MNTKNGKDLNRFIQVLLDIADYYDNKLDCDPDFKGDELTKSIGLGYLALTSHIRSGVKELLNLKALYYNVREREIYYKECYKAKETFMQDIFGEEDADSLYPEQKEKIKAYVRSLFEDDSEDNDND